MASMAVICFAIALSIALSTESMAIALSGIDGQLLTPHCFITIAILVRAVCSTVSSITEVTLSRAAKSVKLGPLFLHL